MTSKSFPAFALLHLCVPAISFLFFDASPLWLLGNFVLAAAIFRSLHKTKSLPVVLLLCLLSGAAFTLTLMLGTCYYMQGEGFNDAFFYHFDGNTLIIAARSYAPVFYPSIFGPLLALIAPALMHSAQPQMIWPRVPVSLLWILALLGNYPIHSLISYQLNIPGDAGVPVFERPAVSAPATGQVDQMTTESAPTIDNASDAEEPGLKVVPEDVRIATTELPEPALSVDPDVIAERAGVVTEQKEGNLPKVQTPPPVTAPEKKNIILVYAESLETLYFDQEIFGDIVPNIRSLSESAHSFTNLVQVRGTGWTIAGIVASQCGFPINISNHLASNSTIASIDKPYADQACLADILSEHGYETTYMGGAPLWFAGKDKFLRTHGYKNILGYEALVQKLEDSDYKSGWGVYDDSLFDLALEELKSLEEAAQPYFLTLLTLDTHHPRGLPSDSCTRLVDNNDSMSNAIFCSDQLISSFVKEAMNIVDMDQTIIVLFSDHLSLRNTLWDDLQENRMRRRLLFLIFDNKPVTVSDRRATHFDVAPTILEAAGFTESLEVGAGRSLFSPASVDAGKSRPADIADSAPSLLGSSASVREHGIEILRQDLALRVGDLTLKAKEAGGEFVSGMYLVVLDEQGIVNDAIYSDDYQLLAKNLNGRYVIGLSVMPDPPHAAAYFFGTISPDGRGITQRRFNRNIKLSPADLWGPIE